MVRPPSVDDVVTGLVESIRSGRFRIGDRLPSVRRLASELGSNPSTVDRALQNLAANGVVRTVPRRGVFVTSIPAPALETEVAQHHALESVLTELRRSGMSLEAVRQAIDRKLAEVFSEPKLLFVECNPVDLAAMAETITNATGVTLTPISLADPTLPATEYDGIAVPVFHLGDLLGRVDISKVVAVDFRLPTATRRDLAALDPSDRVLVWTRSQRGAERVAAMVVQVFGGEVTTKHGTDRLEREEHLDHDVLVYTEAAQLDREILSAVPRTIRIDWELTPSSTAEFLKSVADITEGVRPA